ESTAQQLRALDQLEQARRTLESAQRSGGQKDIQRLKQEAEEALKRQDEISRAVDDLVRGGQSGSANEQKKQQLTERKEALADKMEGLEKDINQAARSTNQANQQAGDKLRAAAGAISNNRLPERIRANGQQIQNGWYDQAKERERRIRGNIEEVLKDLQAAEGSQAARSQGDNTEDALNRARELADNLESLRRRIESGQNPSQQGQSGQQQNQG